MIDSIKGRYAVVVHTDSPQLSTIAMETETETTQAELSDFEQGDKIEVRYYPTNGEELQTFRATVEDVDPVETAGFDFTTITLKREDDQICRRRVYNQAGELEVQGRRTTPNGPVWARLNQISRIPTVYRVEEIEAERVLLGEDPELPEGYRGLGDSTAEHRPEEDCVVITDGGEEVEEAPITTWRVPGGELMVDQEDPDGELRDWSFIQGLMWAARDATAAACRAQGPDHSESGGGSQRANAGRELATDGGESYCATCGHVLPEEVEEDTGVYCPNCGQGQLIPDGGTDQEDPERREVDREPVEAADWGEIEEGDLLVIDLFQEGADAQAPGRGSTAIVDEIDGEERVLTISRPVMEEWGTDQDRLELRVESTEEHGDHWAIGNLFYFVWRVGPRDPLARLRIRTDGGYGQEGPDTFDVPGHGRVGGIDDPVDRMDYGDAQDPQAARGSPEPGPELGEALHPEEVDLGAAVQIVDEIDGEALFYGALDSVTTRVGGSSGSISIQLDDGTTADLDWSCETPGETPVLWETGVPVRLTLHPGPDRGQEVDQ